MALVAGMLGFALNAFSPTIFGESGIIFGGSLAMIAAVALGPVCGLLAGAIASARTLLAWSHPIGFLTFSLEAAIVGWLSSRHRWHPLRADLLFWGALGFPVGLIFFWGSREVPFPAYWANAITLPVNGIFSTMIALVLTEVLQRRLPKLLNVRPTPIGPLRLFLFQRFGMLATLPIAGLGFFIGHEMNTHQRAEATAELTDSAIGTAERVRLHLEAHRRSIVSVARQVELSGASDPQALRALLEGLRRGFSGFRTMLVADAAGKIVATAGFSGALAGTAAGSALSVADREYFKVAVASGRPFVSNVFLGRGFGTDLIVAISAPVLDEKGRVRLVVEGSLNLKSLTDTLRHSPSTQNRDLVVTDRADRVVCSTGLLELPALTSFARHDLYFFARRERRPAFEHAQQRELGAHAESHLASVAEVPGLGWTVYLQEPLWQSQQSIAFFYLTLLFASAAAVGAALILAGGTATVVTAPLHQLGESAHALAQLAPIMPRFDTPYAPLEIVQLGRDMHTAAHRLQQNTAVLERTNTDLRELTRTLDQRVHERTADLNEARLQAESANRAKSEFLASMSHELRTPLNVILGNASLLADGTMGPLAARQLEAIRAVDESGSLLLSLINDILDLSKVEAGMLELDFQEVVVADICQASVRLVRGDATKKNLTLESSVRCAADTTFWADPRRVKQILVNLLSNAVKFTPVGGRITVTVVSDVERRVIIFSVTDTGIGIAVEMQQKLFRPFVQIDSRLSREYSGTGLGLALVRRLTDLHGGGVSLVSAPGQGSTFTVALPLRHGAAHPPPVAPAAAAVPEPVIAGNPRILVAEDSATNIAVLRSYFHSQACQPTFAQDGLEAVKQAVESPPEIILMDVQMPRMDGLEAIQQLRADPRTATIPIICLTALAMTDDEARCRAAGADEFLCKPINFRTLTATINRLLPR